SRRYRRSSGGVNPSRPDRQHGQHPAQARCKMIDRLIKFSLHQRFIILALAGLLTIGGVVSFYRLPIEAYSGVADVEVDVITLWPGHAAEEVERYITIRIEREINGIAKITFLRSISNFGLSNIRVLFADGTDNYWARQQVQERLA